MQHMYDLGRGNVFGMTWLHDVVYMVCCGSSTILRFNATTRQPLTGIEVKGLTLPTDIAAIEQTTRLYVSDKERCVWRLSADGADIQRWLPQTPSDTFSPLKLSVTSNRLLVTSYINTQLRQYDAGGVELWRVQLPDHMGPLHAVESPLTATFIVSHKNTQLNLVNQWQVSEVNIAGQVLRQFTGSPLLPLSEPWHLAVDSRGSTFVADWYNHRILLLDSHLSLCRVIINEHQLNYKGPCRLCYREQTGQLLVGFDYTNSVAVFNVLRR